MNKKLIIFVCTSNTCRSPVAEGIATQYVKKHHLEDQFHIISRGMSEDYEPAGSPASKYSQECALEMFGVDLSSHRSAVINGKEVEEASAIIGMTAAHNRKVCLMFPKASKEGSLRTVLQRNKRYSS